LVLALYPAVAYPHAKLVRSEPQANASLKQAPKTIELWFNEALEHNFCAITVTDAGGNRVDENNLSFPEGDKQLKIELAELGPGTYTVEWRVLSADQHSMKGSYVFTVASEVTPGASASPGQQGGTQNTGQTESSARQPSVAMSEPMQQSGSSWMHSLSRWLHHLAMMMLFGGFAFHLLVLEPSLRKSRGASDTDQAVAIESGSRRIILFSWLSLALLAVISLMELILQAATAFDTSMRRALSPGLLNQVITQTGFGGSWLLQILSIAALAIILFYLSRRTKQEPSGNHKMLWWAGLIASAALFLAPAWTGHAAAAAKEYPFATLTDWLHLVAGGFWVGGLFHLALTLPAAISQLKGRARLHVLHLVIPLFSRLAIASIILIVLTGLYNSWMHVDSFGKLWSTPYGKTLALKVLLVIPMLVLGGVNTFIIYPRATRLLEEEEGVSEGSQPEKLSRSFSRSVKTEAALGDLVLLIAAILVFLQPAREHSVDPASGSKPPVITGIHGQQINDK
jgi:copper transport protein